MAAVGRSPEHSSPAKKTPTTAVYQETATAAQLKDELLSAPTGSEPDRTNGLAPRTILDLGLSRKRSSGRHGGCPLAVCRAPGRRW